MNDKKIAVLIPCYNEGSTIAKVVADYRKALPDACIYVYDNNSADDTVQQAKEAGAVVKHETKQGKGNVMRTMFRDIEADCYLIIDGDDTYPADNAADMCRCVIEDNVDMVIGDRLSSTYHTENKRPFHSAGNSLVCWMINKLFHADIKDIMTGYRAFSRRFVKHFPVMSEGFEIETEMTIHALDKNFSIREIPVQYRNRPEGSYSKLSTFSDGWKVILTIFSLFRDYQPLKFFSFIAVMLILAALVLFIPVFIEYINTGLVPRFPTLIVSGMLALLGCLSYFCGLVLEVIGKKHKQMFEIMLMKG